MRQPVICDGRNIYDPAVMKRLGFHYHGLGRGYNGVEAVESAPLRIRQSLDVILPPLIIFSCRGDALVAPGFIPEDPVFCQKTRSCDSAGEDFNLQSCLTFQSIPLYPAMFSLASFATLR